MRTGAGRQRYNVLGAINAVTHELVREANDGYINAQTVCALLRKLAAKHGGGPITLILDNARYQRCKLVQELAATLNIELLFLPPYSPNLNQIERLWKFVKKTALNSRHYPNFQEFKAGIDKCLDELPTIHRESMETLMTLKFQTFENVSLLAA